MQGHVPIVGRLGDPSGGTGGFSIVTDFTELDSVLQAMTAGLGLLVVELGVNVSDCREKAARLFCEVVFLKCDAECTPLKPCAHMAAVADEACGNVFTTPDLLQYYNRILPGGDLQGRNTPHVTPT